MTLGIIIAVAVVGYGLYITVFPLLRTLKGGFSLLRAGSRNVEVPEDAVGVIPDTHLGFTMADGGDAVDEPRDSKEMSE
jgi:hypothetical protein